MSDYTPTTEQVKAFYEGNEPHSRRGQRSEAFDRWHAQEIRKAEHRGKQQAWVEGAAAAWLESGVRQFGAAYPTDNPTFIPFSLHNKNPYTEES